jgi:hypothetical protein
MAVEEPLNQLGSEIYQKLQTVSRASREAAAALSEQARLLQALLDENRNLRALEAVWLEQKRTLENLEVAHQATLSEVRRCHQVEVESVKREARTRLEEQEKRFRDFEGRARETIRGLREALDQARVENRRRQEAGGQKEGALEGRIVELQARLDAESRVHFQKLSEIEKRHALENEQRQFDAEKSRSFLLSANERLEAIATQKDAELEQARKQIILLEAGRDGKTERELRGEAGALRDELRAREQELFCERENVKTRNLEVLVLKDEMERLRRECAQAREELEISASENEALRSEIAIFRSHQAGIEGQQRYLEDENRLLKSRLREVEPAPSGEAIEVLKAGALRIIES